jgi:hypothetical protein
MILYQHERRQPMASGYLTSRSKFSLALIGAVSVLTFSLTSQAQTVVKGAQPMGAQPMTEQQINQQALQQTQGLLVNPAERKIILDADPKAKAADSKVQQLLGQDSQKAYELSAQLMSTIVAQTGGDPKKMQQLVLELQSNPHALEKLLTPTQRDQIRKMASDLEAKKGSAPVNGGGK